MERRVGGENGSGARSLRSITANARSALASACSVALSTASRTIWGSRA